MGSLVTHILPVQDSFTYACMSLVSSKIPKHMEKNQAHQDFWSGYSPFETAFKWFIVVSMHKNQLWSGIPSILPLNLLLVASCKAIYNIAKTLKKPTCTALPHLPTQCICPYAAGMVTAICDQYIKGRCSGHFASCIGSRLGMYWSAGDSPFQVECLTLILYFKHRGR